ncbi:hypothetical protein SEA_NAIRB_41 [Mycobacterium phage Nairb]|uniref:Uncharacterized protein n=5 Tax=Bernalvirus bernal13 TaxID=1982102 RepID=A0A2P1JRR6_9CAUD|nr:hypothetical protein FH37_gp41 [Mycobacterium phage Bernal13]AIT13455.1 hypothetical protein PBI_RONRAYGUN_42 [Mycobacterium phage RonRayGun]ASJ79122.1 hypothetical protein SEA_ZENTIME222_41 [Mycobacterium phage ZenTime222]AVO21829.1 hypothetical protein SEA_NAIRB_41 [Mycobacterium phage Nairb]QBP28887.1 hypothetical protein SEA_IBRAHIM_42 [Mycobacterium phage Ibrahim]QHB47446.1 hypothetical protein SEA_WHITTY_41 [Mycobacterium phage Whitty]
MSGDNNGRVDCVMCGRNVTTENNRYAKHSTVARGKQRCGMSEQRVPITGTSDDDYLARAQLVVSLAGQLADEDPHLTWDYLTALPAVEVQRLLVVALAAIPTDRTLNELFAWVANLPEARKAVA